MAEDNSQSANPDYSDPDIIEQDNTIDNTPLYLVSEKSLEGISNNMSTYSQDSTGENELKEKGGEKRLRVVSIVASILASLSTVAYSLWSMHIWPFTDETLSENLSGLSVKFEQQIESVLKKQTDVNKIQYWMGEINNSTDIFDKSTNSIIYRLDIELKRDITKDRNTRGNITCQISGVDNIYFSVENSTWTGQVKPLMPGKNLDWSYKLSKGVIIGFKARPIREKEGVFICEIIQVNDFQIKEYKEAQKEIYSMMNGSGEVTLYFDPKDNNMTCPSLGPCMYDSYTLMYAYKDTIYPLFYINSCIRDMSIFPELENYHDNRARFTLEFPIKTYGQSFGPVEFSDNNGFDGLVLPQDRRNGYAIMEQMSLNCKVKKVEILSIDNTEVLKTYK